MSLSEDALVGRYAPLVRRQALQLLARLPSNVELDDLIQAGMMGLLDAIRRYQAMAEAQFETYAITRIRGSMLDELRSQDWLSRSVRAKSRQIEVAIHTLRQRLMRQPTEQEVATELELELDEYQLLLEDASGVQVIHYEDLGRYSEDGQGDALDFLSSIDEPGAAGNPLNHLISNDLRVALVEAIDALPEREKLLFALQFQEDLNQKEIAAVMDITEGRVSQLRSQAIARIRAHLKAAHWQGDRPDETEGQVLF